MPKKKIPTKKKKKAYQKPTLENYGDFAKLTQAKTGNRSDASGKPRTRVAGSIG